MPKPVPRASDIMDSDPITVTEDRVVRFVAECMWQQGCPVAVMVDGGRRPLGVISQQGLMLALLDIVNHGLPPGPLRQYMDPGLTAIQKGAGLLHMAELFVRKGASVRALPVVDGDVLVGVVLRRDVVHAVMEYLRGVEDVGQRVLYLSALREIDETPYFD